MNRPTASTFNPLAAALLAALGIVPLAAQAATIVVITGGDPAPTTTSCTLRQAIVSMNAGAVTGTGCTNTGGKFGSNDTINFDTGVFPPGSQNTITLASGKLSITDANLTIDATANGNVTIDAALNSPVMYDSANIFPAGSLTLNHLTLLNGAANSNISNFGTAGGAICIPYASLTLSNSTVSNNLANNGGGIFASARGTTVINSTIKNNSAASYGGGIYNSAGSVTLIDSTVSGNKASNTASVGLNYGGGGISTQTGGITLTNSTLSANTTSGQGGGIFSMTQVVTLTNSTVSGNSAGLTGGGIKVTSGASLVANNSIVAGNSVHTSSNDINGGSISGTHNQIGGNPMLGALANNGGPTQTMLPQGDSSTSPVIDKAPCLAGIGTDQRGYIRPNPASRNSATPCDIGAVEANSISQTDEIFYNGFEP